MKVEKIGAIVGLITGVGLIVSQFFSYHNSFSSDAESKASEIVLRRDMDLSFIDLKLKRVEREMRPYQDKGISNLSVVESQEYNGLQTRLKDLEKNRKTLTGF